MPPRSLADYMRHVVSDRKNRYIDEKYDLDLSYITPSLIVMGWPSTGMLEKYYRNNMTTVQEFLKSRHNTQFKVYNFCSERTYDSDSFEGPIVNYPFPDHQPPRFAQIPAFVADIREYLAGNKSHVAVLHCKAGKGRSGTMCCSYLITEGFSKEDAFQYYTQQRIGKGQGLTLNSQLRYVGYWDYYWHQNGKLEYKPRKISIKSVTVKRSTSLGFNEWRVKLYSHGMLVSWANFHKSERIFDNGTFVCKANRVLTSPWPDVQFKIYRKTALQSTEKLGHFWINFFFETIEGQNYGTGQGHRQEDGTYAFRIAGKDLDYDVASSEIEYVEVIWEELADFYPLEDVLQEPSFVDAVKDSI